MAYNNMLNPAADVDKEERQFAAEVETVKNWWKDSRWRYTKRPFTAEQIVAKRGALKIEYPSNVQSKKLWNILEERFKVKMARKRSGYTMLTRSVRTRMPVTLMDVWSQQC
jgi:isocitrate lyase